MDGPRECQKEWISQKNKYHTLTHICGIYKDGTDEHICKAETDTDVENGCMAIKWGGRGGMD